MNNPNLFARYAALKKKVAGNYEKLQYEHTPGASIYERSRITPLTVPTVVFCPSFSSRWNFQSAMKANSSRKSNRLLLYWKLH